jgi:CubicO group peptidase (beta-lactamase class C family)
MRGVKLLTATLLATASTFAALTASAQSGALRPAVDAIVQPAMRDEQIPALIIAISEGGRRSYIAYTGTEEAPLAADSIVEVGSITKVLTTTLFAEALVQGQMAPDGSIQEWMPHGIKLPWKTRQITPVQLASYRSGMPRLPSDAPQGGVEARDIDHYTTADFRTGWHTGRLSAIYPRPISTPTPASACWRFWSVRRWEVSGSI